jgi:hypothetical protein
MKSEWTVWSDSVEPVKEGTEDEVKEFVMSAPELERSSLYIQNDLTGQEFEYDFTTQQWNEMS